MAILNSVAESVVVISSRVDTALQRQIEEKLDNAGVAILGSAAQCVVVPCGRVDASLQRQIEKKLDNVRVAIKSSKPKGAVVVCRRSVATLHKVSHGGDEARLGSCNKRECVTGHCTSLAQVL